MTVPVTSSGNAGRGDNRKAVVLSAAVLMLVLLVSITVRIRLLAAPFERDEGEHATMAQTVLSGHAPWQLAYNMKLPGTDAAYAVILALFGQTATAVRLGLLLLNIATIFLIARLGKDLFGTAGGNVAGGAYGVLTFSQNVFGTIAHSTHFVAFFASLAVLLLWRSDFRAGRVFVAGVVFGMAFLMKQPGIAFAFFGAVWLIWRWRDRRTTATEGLRVIALFFGGVLLPYASLCLLLWKAGVFGRFWFWTVTLARAYAGQLSLSTQIQYFQLNFPRVVGPNIFLWMLALLGIATTCWNPATRRGGFLTGALLAFSFLAVCAGGVFNPHYFIMMFPALALACGAWAAALGQGASVPGKSTSGNSFADVALVVMFGFACLYSVYEQRDYLFSMTPLEFSRNTYGLNPFPEAEQVGEYIRLHSEPQARVAVLGSEAEIYFYSDRQPATGYLFTYGLMETHQYAAPSQDEMIDEILRSRPEYIVYVGVPASWLQRPGSAQTIFYWFADYVPRHYDVVGAVDLVHGEPTRYIWGSEAASHQPASPAYLTVYRRR